MRVPHPDADPDADVPLLYATSYPHPDVHRRAAAGAVGPSAVKPGAVKPAAVPPGPDGDAQHLQADAAGFGPPDPDDPDGSGRRPVWWR
jgi:hypothetical protein